MPNKAVPKGEIVVSDRGQTTLTKVRSTAHTRYRVEEFPGGILLLVPLRSVDDAAVPEGMRDRLRTSLTGEDAESGPEVEDWRA